MSMPLGGYPLKSAKDRNAGRLRAALRSPIDCGKEPLSRPLPKSAGFGEGRSSASIHQKILPLRPCATSRCPLKNIKDRNAGGGLLRERGERMNGELFRGTKEGTIIPAGFLVIWGCSLGTIRGERFGACGSRSSDRRRND
jgi:hypothetical protein